MMNNKTKKYFFTIITIALLLFNTMIVFGTGISTNPDHATIDMILLNQDPDPAEPGEFLEVRWKVVKYGNNKLEDLEFLLESEYPFTIDPSNKQIQKVGDWQRYSEDNEFYTLYYKLRVNDDALEANYDLKLSYRYGTNLEWNTQEYSIRVGDEEKPNLVLGTLQTEPLKLMADTNEAKLNVEIENIGDESAENLKIELELPEGFEESYAYSTRDNLGTISEESSKTATFYVDIDENVEAGKHEANLKIVYKENNDDDNELKTINIPISLPINHKPKFEIVSMKTIPEKIYPNDKVQLLLRVKNVGGEEAKSLSLRAYKEASQPFDFDEKSDFIGTLNPGEEGDAVLEFDVDEDASIKEYKIDLEMRSIFSEEVLVQEDSIKITIEEPVKNENTKLILIGAVILVMLLIGAYYLKWKN